MLWQFLLSVILLVTVSSFTQRPITTKTAKATTTALHISSSSSDFFQSWKQRLTSTNFLQNKKQEEEEKSESELLVDYINYKPWRAPKVKNLKIHYKPWKESWQERFRPTIDEADTIYLYNQPEGRRGGESTRVNEVWQWPWLWTKIKAERLSWLMKAYMDDVHVLTPQEHIEMDCFFSEFDMPVRWGFLRLKELEVLNVLAFWIMFWTDFRGITPTDLGLRPDGTVRACPLQSTNCLSSSNAPTDNYHYAPPLRWARSKSPAQAYEEIKDIYANYPKRGLRWSYGWIDRGGWKPQSFSDAYFYAQADSLAFQFTDDIELVMNPERREVQVRSATRQIGDWDEDVQILRYNQFVRMLTQRHDGWLVEPLPRNYLIPTAPIRFADYLITNSFQQIHTVSNNVLQSLGANEDVRSVWMERADEWITPYAKLADQWLAPVSTQANEIFKTTVDEVNHLAVEFEKQWFPTSPSTANKEDVLMMSSQQDQQPAHEVGDLLTDKIAEIRKWKDELINEVKHQMDEAAQSIEQSMTTSESATPAVALPAANNVQKLDRKAFEDLFLSPSPSSPSSGSVISAPVRIDRDGNDDIMQDQQSVKVIEESISLKQQENKEQSLAYKARLLRRNAAIA